MTNDDVFDIIIKRIVKRIVLKTIEDGWAEVNGTPVHFDETGNVDMGPSNLKDYYASKNGGGKAGHHTDKISADDIKKLSADEIKKLDLKDFDFKTLDITGMDIDAVLAISEKMKEAYEYKHKDEVDNNSENEEQENMERRGHLYEYELTSSEKTNAIMNDTGVDRQTAKDYKNAVEGFTAGGYSTIRALTGGRAQGDKIVEELTKDPSFIKMATDIEKFIEKSPKWNGGELYRGVSVSDETAANIEKAFKTGTLINQAGVSSWSSARDIAEDFAEANKNREGHKSVIFKTAGTNQGTSVQHLSSCDDEDEVIISGKAQWKITGVNEIKSASGKSVTVYTCEEVKERLVKCMAQNENPVLKSGNKKKANNQIPLVKRWEMDNQIGFSDKNNETAHKNEKDKKK